MNMTTNQMVKLFSKVLNDAPPVRLSKKEMIQIKELCELVSKSNG